MSITDASEEHISLIRHMLPKDVDPALSMVALTGPDEMLSKDGASERFFHVYAGCKPSLFKANFVPYEPPLAPLKRANEVFVGKALSYWHFSSPEHLADSVRPGWWYGDFFIYPDSLSGELLAEVRTTLELTRRLVRGLRVAGTLLHIATEFNGEIVILPEDLRSLRLRVPEA